VAGEPLSIDTLMFWDTRIKGQVASVLTHVLLICHCGAYECSLPGLTGRIWVRHELGHVGGLQQTFYGSLAIQFGPKVVAVGLGDVVVYSRRLVTIAAISKRKSRSVAFRFMGNKNVSENFFADCRLLDPTPRRARAQVDKGLATCDDFHMNWARIESIDGVFDTAMDTDRSEEISVILSLLYLYIDEQKEKHHKK
jgi:hypothetical protein